MAFVKKHEAYGGMHLTQGKKEGYEGVGSVTTTAGGDIDIDLTGQFDSIDYAIIQQRSDTVARTTIFDAADDAVAGHLKFRVFTSADGLVLNAGLFEFFYTVFGSSATRV